MSRFTVCVVIAVCIGWPVAWGQSAGEQIVAALERYRLAVLEFDIEREVSSFTEDAELSQGNEAVVQGRTTIRSLLTAPNSAKVIAYDLHAAATRVLGSTAIQNGVYSQRIISADHESMLVKGVFEVQWARQPDGTWLISRLHTEAVESGSS
jgi:ketosteroid isomerase-like protein